MTVTHRLHRAPAAWLASVVLLLAACGGTDPAKQLTSAKAYIDKGETQAAIIELRSVLQQKADLAEARFLLGQLLLENGEAASALVEFRKALELKHPAAAVAPSMARAMFEQGQAGLVVAQFGDTRLDDKPAQARLLTTVAQAYLQLGQTPKAEASFNLALEAVPGHVPARVGLARMLAASGDAPKALQAVEAIISGGVADADTWALQGDLLAFTRNDRDAALAAYRKALGLNPKHLHSHIAVISLQLLARDLDSASAQVAAMQKARPGNPMALLFAGQVAYEKRDFKTAREVAQQLLKAAPDNPQVNQLAAAIEMASGSASVAKVHLGKTLQASPNNMGARRMLAATHLRSGEAAKALDTLQPLLEGGSSDGLTLGLAGEAHMQLGELDKAGDMFARAAKANPESAEAQTALARTRLLKGDAVGAVAELERIAAASPAPTADLELVNAHLRRGSFQAALQAIEGLERKQPGKPLALQLRGAAYQGMKDMASARSNFEKALAVDPGYFPAAFSLARLDMVDKKPQAAQARFESVLKVQPGHLQALLALADLKSRGGAPVQEVTDVLANAVRLNPNDVAARVSLVNHHLNGKRNDAALTAAQQADAALPGQPAVLDALGRAQMAAGQQNQAMATFNKILAVQPLSVGAHLRVADANLAAKDSAAAIQTLRRAIVAQPNAPVLYQRLFLVLVQTNQAAEALKLAREVQKRHPSHSLGFLLEGDAHRAVKNIDAALVAYKSALGKAMPADAALRYHATLSAQGKTADADRFAGEWLKGQPKDAGFAFYLADVKLARNELPAAEALYRKVLDLQPDHAVALNNTAWLMLKARKPGALAMAEQANALRPDQPALMDTLAMALASENKLEQAIDLQKKAMALAPESPQLKLGLARIYLQGGQKPQARQLLEPLSELGDKFPDHAEVKTLLSSL